MKFLYQCIALIFLGSGILLIQSCADECSEVVCFNEGICDNGECDCPIGFIGQSCEIVDITRIQDLLDNGVTPLDLINNNVPVDSLYGKRYKEGLIFYVDANDEIPGVEGMVAAIGDQTIEGATVWGCYETDIVDLNNVPWNGGNFPDGVGAEIGDGVVNTNKILTTCTIDMIAAKLCQELGSDWFLPSIKELGLMYTNLDQNGFGGFEKDFYWSSTEYDPDFAWTQTFTNDFTSGVLAILAKFEDLHVRAAKTF